MAKKLSSAYWRKRQREREAKALSDIKEVEAEYKRALEVARRNISREISRLGQSFMRENQLTYADALKKLSGAEHRSWRMEVSQYMKKYKKLLKKEPVEAQKLWIELETLAMRSRISHLDAIHAQINMELMAMGQEVSTSGRDALHGIYGSTFKGVAMDLGVKTGFSADMVKAVIDRPWSGLNYSQRIWKNTDRLAAVLKQEVVTSLIQGVNLKKMESRLRKKVVGASKTDVERLLRTEVNYTMNQATLDGYKEAQVEMYIFDATIDGRTSQICAGLNGERFKLEKAVVGINYPPMHPRCRSTTEPILEEKAGKALKKEKKEGIIEEKSYDWKNLKELRSPEAVSRYFSNDPDRKAWLKGISLDEKDSLKAYTGSKYRGIGPYNRKIMDWAPTGKYGSIIDEARKMRIPKPPERLPGEPMMDYIRRKKKVWGYQVPYGAVQGELDVKKWNADLDALISRYDLKEDLLVYRGVDRNAMPDFKSPADLIGKPYSDPSYMSTSPVLQSSWTKEIVMKIKVRKGLGAGAYIGEISEHKQELEFLLPRETRFKITDAKTIDISGEKIVLVEMEVDPDDGGRKTKKKSD